MTNNPSSASRKSGEDIGGPTISLPVDEIKVEGKDGHVKLSFNEIGDISMPAEFAEKLAWALMEQADRSRRVK